MNCFANFDKSKRKIINKINFISKLNNMLTQK